MAFSSSSPQEVPSPAAFPDSGPGGADVLGSLSTALGADQGPSSPVADQKVRSFVVEHDPAPSYLPEMAAPKQFSKDENVFMEGEEQDLEDENRRLKVKILLLEKEIERKRQHDVDSNLEGSSNSRTSLKELLPFLDTGGVKQDTWFELYQLEHKRVNHMEKKLQELQEKLKKTNEALEEQVATNEALEEQVAMLVRYNEQILRC